jgi:hypothetical protein
MKKIIKLTESDLTRLVKTIVENISTEGIPQEDLDALSAEANKMVEKDRVKAQEIKQELDAMRERMQDMIKSGKVNFDDSTVEEVIKMYTSQKEKEYEYYSTSSVDRYLQNLIFEFKRKKAYEDYEREKIERRKTKKIDKKDIIDLFVTALEGGSNYWYYLPRIPDGVREIMAELDMELTEAIGEYVLRGGSIDINDAEDEETKLGTVDMTSLLEAIDILKNYYTRAYENIIDEEYDADDADIFFQLAVMGEVTFG